MELSTFDVSCQYPSNEKGGAIIHGVLTKRGLADRIDAAIGRRKNEEIAAKIGVGASAISNYRTGVRTPNAIKFAALCRELGISADVLLGLRERRGEPIGEDVVAEESPPYPAVPEIQALKDEVTALHRKVDELARRRLAVGATRKGDEPD